LVTAAVEKAVGQPAGLQFEELAEAVPGSMLNFRVKYPMM
jgi:hypothetical protein